MTKLTPSSLPIEVMELAGGLLLAGRDDAILVDVDDALRLQLFEDSLGLLILLLHALVVGELLLGRGNELELGCDLLLSVGLSLLGGLDLFSGSSALAGDLQHVRGHALRDYKDRRLR